MADFRRSLRVPRADSELAACNLNRALRLLEKGAIPASCLDAPRAYKHASFHDDRPDADEAVRASAGPNS